MRDRLLSGEAKTEFLQALTPQHSGTDITWQLKGQKGEGGPYAANKTMPLLCLMEHWAA